MWEEYCRENQARKPFKHDLPMKAKKSLELIRFDVCGPFEVRSNGGNNYFLTLIDEFIRHMWKHIVSFGIIYVLYVSTYVLMFYNLIIVLLCICNLYVISVHMCDCTTIWL